MIYLDTSALIKLLLREPESVAMRHWMERSSDRPMISSALLKLETLTKIRNDAPHLLATADTLLESVNLMPISDEIIDIGASLPIRGLRSLDAIHLASALSIAASLSAFVTYDRRLIIGADALDLPTLTPT